MRRQNWSVEVWPLPIQAFYVVSVALIDRLFQPVMCLKNRISTEPPRQVSHDVFD